MKGELVKVITTDGLELKGFFSDQKSEIAVFHSHGTAGDFYTHEFVEVEGNKLSKEKISFLTANNRGHDVYADIRHHRKGKVEWTQIGGGFEKFEDCLFDIDAWINFLVKRGVKKIILQGHSLSQKNLYYQYVKNNPRIVGQIHLSPQNDDGIMYYSLGKKKYKKINNKIKQMVKEGRGNKILPKEFSPISYITSIDMYNGYLTDYGKGTLTPYHSPNSPNWKILSEVIMPILIVFGSKDIYMKPSVEVAVSLIKEKSNASVEIIKGASHSYIGYEKELITVIFDWIKKNYL